MISLKWAHERKAPVNFEYEYFGQQNTNSKQTKVWKLCHRLWQWPPDLNHRQKTHTRNLKCKTQNQNCSNNFVYLNPVLQLLTLSENGISQSNCTQELNNNTSAGLQSTNDKFLCLKIKAAIVPGATQQCFILLPPSLFPSPLTKLTKRKKERVRSNLTEPLGYNSREKAFGTQCLWQYLWDNTSRTTSCETEPLGLQPFRWRQHFSVRILGN